MTKIKCRLCLKMKNATDELFCRKCFEVGFIEEAKQQARKEFAERLRKRINMEHYHYIRMEIYHEIDKTLKEMEKENDVRR